MPGIAFLVIIKRQPEKAILEHCERKLCTTELGQGHLKVSTLVIRQQLHSYCWMVRRGQLYTLPSVCSWGWDGRKDSGSIS